MELLFEIGCEDLPSRFVLPALEQLNDIFSTYLKEYRISSEGIRVAGTTRRLTLMVHDLATKQDDLSEEKVGPPCRVAFKDGIATKAAEGFAKGLGVSVDDLYQIETTKGDYVAAKVFERGKPTTEVLGEILIKTLNHLSFPKSMRWSNTTMSFARPIRWIVALYGGEVVPLTLTGFEHISSSNITYGHRFSPKGNNQALSVTSIDDYIQQLNTYDVILFPEERRKSILNILDHYAKESNGEIIEDLELLDEVTNLVEKPHGLLLTYDESYLELPDEVLITSMRNHQRYFAIRGQDSLLNSCVIIYNTPVNDPDIVRKGNDRVLRARLDDAKFFWNQDLKHPLEWYNEKLNHVTWIHEVGSMAERSSRISRLASAFSRAFHMTDEDQQAAERAGQLSKADLVTAMVFEFTELQGIMGRAYAIKSGEDEKVAQAIYEQYLPKGADDDIPTTQAGTAVALAEKIDALVGCFGNRLIPTSTADPYALRRSAIGIVKILQERKEQISLIDLLELSYDIYINDGISFKDDRNKVIETLYQFIITRLEFQLTQEYPTDIVRSVTATHSSDIASIYSRVAALTELYDQPDFAPLAAGFKRVVNLVKKDKEALEDSSSHNHVNVELFVEEAEKSLYQAYLEAKETTDEAIEEQNWRVASKALIELKEPIDHFFDDVMVMTEDVSLRKNRIYLLAQLRNLFFQIADLSIIH